jgi:ABC-type sugar transport system ATPase subunit
MTGRPAVAGASVSITGRAGSTPRLQVRQLRCPGRFDDVSFDVLPGEIVGLTGRLGSGRSDLARALFGLRPIDRGEVRVDGRPVGLRNPRSALTAGIAYVPDDRLREGLFPDQSVGRNLVAGLLPSLGGRLGWLHPGQLAARTRPWLERLRIRPAEDSLPVGHLSGGNQQKVVLARWLACGAKVLLLNRPTSGVDVGAKAEIHRLLRGWAGEGMSLLLISDELPELLELAPRLLHFREGRVVAEWTTAGLDPDSLMARLDAP